MPHTTESGRSPAASLLSGITAREMTVVRIPLKSAKHHFGVSLSRGTRPYNEDAYQAGVVEVPAFAKRAPISLTRSQRDNGNGEGTSADSASGDPQVFYFGVFDGHGGRDCSSFLREHLHDYIEKTAKEFELASSLKASSRHSLSDPTDSATIGKCEGKDQDESVKTKIPSGAPVVKWSDRVVKADKLADGEASTEMSSETTATESDVITPPKGEPSLRQDANEVRALELERLLISEWQETVGGYFKRFKPPHFSIGSGGQGQVMERERLRKQAKSSADLPVDGIGIEAVMTYAFLKADYNFVTAEASDEDLVRADRALNEDEILGEASRPRSNALGPRSFNGGSTCSVAMISTPTPMPFWNPASPSTLLTSHVGDTRILLCSTSTGGAVPLTTNHHPSSPVESSRLRRYAATFVTDSFGEERMSGLANTRAFGDTQSKRLGVSAEPEIRRLELKPAEYSFLVLISDGVSGTLSDQEIVDIVKEARTPDQAAKDVVSFATEVSKEGDNATCLVVRLGGWERRVEGGLGSLGTKEARDWRRQEATDPRSRRT
ncbi:MAG: hypothetical protein M1825_006043 [Sarcosagium campestre]|nr:MAG: hypothetical protein M1825_006043 [Sarcosagium campestre]